MISSRKKRRLFVLIKSIISIAIIIFVFYPPSPYVFINYKLSDCDGCHPIELPAFPQDSTITQSSVVEQKNIIPKIGILRGDNYINIDFSNRNGVWLYFTPDIKYVTDSLEAQERHSRYMDSLRKKNTFMGTGTMRGNNYFKTNFKHIKLNGISNININGNDITISPTIDNIRYNITSIINTKKITLSTKSFTLDQFTSKNSAFFGGGNFKVIGGSLKNSNVINSDTLNISSTKIDSCNLVAKFASLSYLKIHSNNTLTFGDNAELTNIEGEGKLSLKSNASLTKEMQMSIDTFRKRYANVDFVLRNKLKPSTAKLSNIDISLIDFDSDKIKIEIDTTSNNKMVNQMYIDLINRFKDNEKERQIYDIEYHRYLRKTSNSFLFKLKDRLWEQWSRYGYDTENIYRILWLALLFFFSVNYLFFPYLLRFGYPVSNFYMTYIKTRRYKIFKRIFVDAYFSFVYTLLLFWLFRIELNNLKVNKPAIFLWIVVQHLVSLILLTLALKELIL
nr:hypothetical protein [uncultured Chryseobacterium sp.]